MQFLLNQQHINAPEQDAGMTVLNWLRQRQRRCGTKEGCASGDCGACTVVIGREEQGAVIYEAVNSCVTLMGALQGRQLLTVEDLRQGDALHAVQQAMVIHHGTQCGFCTPGVVMSLFALHRNSQGWHRQQAELALAGNLCRCTGYRSILAAAQHMCAQPVSDGFSRQAPAIARQLHQMKTPEMERIGPRCWLPKTVAQLAELYLAEPQAKLVAGGTDLTLHIAGQPTPLIALEHIAELKRCRRDGNALHLGAAAPLSQLLPLLQTDIPAFARLLYRFASQQIRNRGTLGGNLANASPVGDCAPVLLALDARLLLQCGEQQRQIPLSTFYTGYRQTQLRRGEFIHSVILPDVTTSHNLAAWKVTKRLDDDISAVAAAFHLTLAEGLIQRARVAFGGVAAVPLRATACEQALIGHPASAETLARACDVLAAELQPLDDYRASGRYRLQVAGNLLRRYFYQLNGELPVTEVSHYVP